MSITTVPHAAPDSRAAPKRPGLVLFLVCTAIFMLMLDATIVSAAFADIRADFDASIDGLQWVVDAYALPLAGVLLTFATLGDRLGRKRVFVGGMAVFTAASLALSFSRTILELNVLRAVQGVGAAMLFATALPLLAAAFPDRAARAKTIGVYGAVMAAATVAGPVLGGLLVTSSGWRVIFTVNVPVGLAVLALAVARLPETTRTPGRRVDWLGSALLTGGLVAGVFALTRGNSLGWTSLTTLTLAVAAVGLVVGFVLWERRAPHPLFDIGMVSKPGFTGTAIVSVAHMATMMAATSFLALYLINTLGLTPLEAGVRLLPISGAALVAAPLAAVFAKRVPSAVSLPATLALVAVGMWLMSNHAPGSPWTYFVPGMVLAGVGLGAITAVSQAAALTFAPDADAGMASATFGTLRQVGMAIGVAGLGAMFGHAARDSALAFVPGRTELVDAIGSGAGTSVIPSDQPTLRHIAEVASADGLTALTSLGATVCAAGVIAAALAFGLSRLRR
ncbi:MAG TPA: MFS transporter [Actinokineospora sp.]|nr:MFS transporter [Actinokineospora sp.]